MDESPEPDEAPRFEPARIGLPADEAAPVYENHRPSAQMAWQQLTERQVMQETTRQEPDGRQMHVELGTSAGWSYLYCANSFDQRQLVVMRKEQHEALRQYYAEIIAQAP